MKNHMRYLPLLMASFLFYNCQRTPANAVRCVDTNFKDEIESNQNLEFTFNKDLLSSDSLVNVWLDDNPVSISPAVKGKCKWVSRRVLVFSPLEEFPMASDFKITLTDKVTSNAPKQLSLIGEIEYKVHTAYLDLIGSNTRWIADPDDPTKIQLRTDIKFNMVVNPQKAQEMLEATINGKKTEFKIVNTKPSKTLSLVFASPPTTTEKAVVKVIVKKFAKSMQEDEFATKSSVVGTNELKLTNLETAHSGLEGSVFIHTSQPVNENSAKTAVTIEPKVSFSVNVDDQGITISSEEFDPEETYTIHVSQEMIGIFGGRMDGSYNEDIEFGDIQPAVHFENTKAEFLGSKGSRNVAITLTKVDKIKVTVYKVFQNNIMSFMRQEKDWNYFDEYNQDENDYMYHEYQGYTTDDVAEKIWEKEYKADNLKDYGYAKLLKLDIQDKYKQFKGIYVVKVEDEDRAWNQDSKIVTVSDIGLIVKQDKDQVHIFANSILNTEPLKNVEVTVISTTNQELGKVKTDKEGYASLPIADATKLFRVGMVTAVSEDSDFNYVLFNKTQVNTARYDVGGKYLLAYGYDAYIYGERDIYRPGETVHLNTIIRTNDWTLPGEMPVKAKLIMPNGKEFQTVKNYLDKQGAFECSFDMPPSAITGTYNFQVFSGDDQLLGTKNIMVEEFMPDRIKVDLKTDTTAYAPNRPVTAMFTATNYFGPPAANRNYEVTFTIDRKYDIFPDFPDYTFSGSKNANFSTNTKNGMTDANGNGAETFEIPNDYKETGILEGTVFTTVFDETGRPVNRQKKVDIYTQDVFYGIRFVDDFFSTRTPIKIPVIALNKEGKPLNLQKANLKIIHKTWETILKRVDGQLRYESQEKDEVVDNKNITINGKNSVYTYYAKESGDYEVRLSAINSENYVSFNFYAYGWSDTYNSSFEVSTEGKIDIETDKKNYKVGEDAKVLLKLPFDGKVLVTLERERVIDHFYINSKNKAASFNIDLDDKHVPNIYVSATLIKPNVEDGMPLTVAYGFQPILVENPDNKINVAIQAVETTRSKTKQTIKFKTKSNTEMTVAVVDEGILALKDQQAANPYDYFYAKRALSVDMYNIYPFLFPEVTALGGGFDDISKRVNPLTNKRVKLVSFWSGIIKSDMLGNASFTIDIPQFSGNLRVMAVAYDGKRFGAGQKNMRVADPIVISSGIPRFVAPNDLVTIPVNISNTTNKPVSGVVTIQADGALQPDNAAPVNITIPANTEQNVDFAVKAKMAVGQGKITVNVKALNETFSEVTDITCRPNASLTKYSGTGIVKNGSSTSLDLNKAGQLASSSKSVIISNSPLVQFSKNLDYLINYPYGCVEQTVSAVFPQLYYNDLTKLMTNKNKSSLQANNNIQAAIAKLQSMQLSNGALSYWPNYGSESWWGTAYALHFLIEADKAGYVVNESFKKKMENYLTNRLKTRSTEWLYYGNGKKKEVISEEVAYSLYVLALDGEGKISSLNYYKSNPEMLTMSSKYLIACSYALMGEKKKFQEMLPKAYEDEKAEPMFGGSFYSDLRNMALTLNTLLETDPGNSQISYLAKHVADAMRMQYYLNTQETAFGFLAMGKIAQKANKTNPTATIMSNGKVIGNYAGKDLVITGDKIANNQFSVSAKSGDIYYFWSMEGIPMDGKVKEEDNFLQVRRRYLNRYGVALGNTIDQNEMVVVEISIRSTAGMSIPNVAITDLLPAGFEIENTRLTELPQLDWIKDATTPDYQDVRDDRMNLIVTANTSINKYYYVCRAVSLGTFNVGPVCADAMYRGEYHSYNGAKAITVARKKTA